jgi:hypothetical protein
VQGTGMSKDQKDHNRINEITTTLWNCSCTLFASTLPSYLVSSTISWLFSYIGKVSYLACI